MYGAVRRISSRAQKTREKTLTWREQAAEPLLCSLNVRDRCAQHRQQIRSQRPTVKFLYVEWILNIVATKIFGHVFFFINFSHDTIKKFGTKQMFLPLVATLIETSVSRSFLYMCLTFSNSSYW